MRQAPVISPVNQDRKPLNFFYLAWFEGVLGAVRCTKSPFSCEYRRSLHDGWVDGGLALPYECLSSRRALSGKCRRQGSAV